MSRHFVAPKGIGAPKPNVEAFAENVAKQVEFEAGDSIEELVERVGGRLEVGTSGSGDEESGSIVARALDDFTIYVSRHTSLKRDRFTIAHELGHLLLHLGPLKKTNPDAIMRATRWVDEGDDGQRRAEWEANWFAAGFLMPSTEFKEIFAAQGLVGVQNHFGVSGSAAQVRAKSLGLK